MQKVSSKTISKIKIKKSELAKKLNVSFKIEGKRISLSGNEENKYIAEKIIKAVESGFELEIAIMLKEPDYVFEEIPIKKFSRRKKPELVKSRIIGTKGRTLKLLQELSNCNIVLKENIVSIIGRAEEIRLAENAVKRIIQGSKQANVYSYLENSRKRFFPEDLGLKENFKKSRTKKL